jgi:hypothetical protein
MYDVYMPRIAMERTALNEAELARYNRPSSISKIVIRTTARAGTARRVSICEKYSEKKIASSRANAHTVRDVEVVPATVAATGIDAQTIVSKVAPTLLDVTLRRS